MDRAVLGCMYTVRVRTSGYRMVSACQTPKNICDPFTSTRVDQYTRFWHCSNSVVWDSVRITVMIMASIIRIYSMRRLKDGMNI